MNFLTFKAAVDAQFQKMQRHQLYVTVPPVVNGQQASAKDTLYEAYQNAFPSGSNEVFRERPRHDCQCCKSFIRTVGNVVAIIDGELVSIWDVDMPDEPIYQQVANAMSAMVKAWNLGDEFKHYLPYAGTDFNFEDMEGVQHKWDHFYSTIFVDHVMPEDAIPTYLGEQRAIRDVFIRGLQTITTDAIDTVLDLLANGSLYRAEERESVILDFREAVLAYQQNDASTLWAYKRVREIHPSVAKLRNSAMGTLLIAITDGEDLEDAVRAYEKKMAPENYKRTSAVVTPAMKAKAQEFVEKNGLESALYRRHAKPTDITVNNVLFANRKAKSQIEGSVFDAIETSSKKKQDFSKVETVQVEDFMFSILPHAESIELMLEAEHLGKLVSLTAPVYSDAKSILQWNNNFAWSYKGEYTDAIKERVKNAGGVVEADFCARLAWNNTDDLDLYLVEPTGYQICFHQRNSPNKGQLDIDMNAPGSQKVRNPVENIFYKNLSTMRDGEYHLAVNQYQRRESIDVGFEVNIDFMGQVYKFSYDKMMQSQQTVSVVKFVKRGAEMEITQSLPYTAAQTEEWGVKTQQWTPVNMVLLSPNHWDDNRNGNKHWFFVLDGCVNPDPVRGFYNEFLKSEFHEHRKTFEVLGAKIRAPYSEEQMSGVGFSSTVRSSVLAKVSGAFNRVIRIAF